ncbi:Holliday junction resolvase RuvX [Candidatus Parcubacteria bacterium]|nr:Holliday junction resolvase RuvX [Patescibacteria group bacterium]MBU4482349.1 Holliday junction resolvase RuvX [Patescibacteria group bacterium]MCG2687060.1 Holliday junction resolvase RuvX [Candidatus Parcubacteria bacterium]
MSKILAIDYGTKNIGLALSDDEQKLGFAYKTINNNKIILKLKNICEAEDVEKIIIGLPINLSGAKTKSTEMVFNFVKKLKKELNLPIEMVDERLSTAQALRLENKNKKNIDELSAQIILQAYLDSAR